MKVVIQEEETGCGLASIANICEKTYQEIKTVANQMGIFANDQKLYSDTSYIRKLLDHFGFKTSVDQIPFSNWNDLPSLALLAIKWHLENNQPYWHWVVFKRKSNQAYLLDSANYLTQNLITDFKEIQPKWYIEIYEKNI